MKNNQHKPTDFQKGKTYAGGKMQAKAGVSLSKSKNPSVAKQGRVMWVKGVQTMASK